MNADAALCAAAVRRRGMTLVELLVTIAIIGILSSMILFAMRGAQESAKAAKTKAIITKIHELLMPLYESYRTRRLEVDTAGLDSQLAARERLNGVRRLMQLEMPERWNEVVTLVSESEVAPPAIAPLQRQPALSQAYARRYHRNRNADDTLRTTDQNQGAECLYLIVTLATADGEGRGHFSESDIGDTDLDGAPEFLDGWGRPISFLRWPAGFVSEKQPLFGGGTGAEAEASAPSGEVNDPVTVTNGGSGYSPANPPPVAIIGGGTGATATAEVNGGSVTNIKVQSGGSGYSIEPNVFIGRDGRNDHDPFDPTRYDTGAYRLIPLIYSGGPDGEKEILTIFVGVTVDYESAGMLNPYQVVELDGKPRQIGTPLDLDGDGNERWHDNIHNHLMGTR